MKIIGLTGLSVLDKLIVLAHFAKSTNKGKNIVTMIPQQTFDNELTKLRGVLKDEGVFIANIQKELARLCERIQMRKKTATKSDAAL